MTREKLFSVTIKDCEVQTFSSSGAGGQHRDHGNSAVRIIHRPSGARGEAQDSRSQLDNKRAAFKKMAESLQFQHWINQMSGKIKTDKQLAEEVEQDLQPKNLRVEGKQDHKWVVLQ